MTINKQKLKIFEVGVGDVFSSKTKMFWGSENTEVTLFEPNPFLYKYLLKKTKNIKNINLFNIAISNEEKIGHLVCAGVTSYIKDIPSPINRIYLDKLNEILSNFTVPVNLMRFDSFDDGDIDFLRLGMEGSEFTVFETMKSRPHIISIHNYFANDYGYSFYKWNDISAWINTNGYFLLPGIPDALLINKESVAQNILTLN